ncbi:MAG: rod shape-determining protein RodA [bacterium]
MPLVQIDRRSIANFDLLLFLLVIGLNGIGILNLGSAAGGEGLWKAQLYRFLLSLLPFAVVIGVSYSNFEKLTPLIYILSLALLVGVLFFGRQIGGARSWYDFGFIRLQPSEFVKIAIILVVARIYHRYRGSSPWGLRDLILPLVLILAPVASILKEPDMGTALIILLFSGTMLLFIGIKGRIIVTAVIIALVSFYPAWKWGLKEHQKERILTFVYPERDAMGAGYHSLQSKIAIGSGGLFGKGYKHGTIHMLRFLPEQQTDFVFSVWAEEWGFVWVAGVLILYFLLIFRGLQAAREAKDRFGLMIAVGGVALIFWHTFINVAMVVGLFPVIGVPLPFMSYGGSNLITFMIAVGLIINVRMRKYYF